MKLIGLSRRYLKTRSIFQTLIHIALEWLLNNNLHRHSLLSLDRNCAFCINEIENKHHLLFPCPIYADLKTTCIPDFPLNDCNDDANDDDDVDDGDVDDRDDVSDDSDACAGTCGSGEARAAPSPTSSSSSSGTDRYWTAPP